jgi:hypothetical protein
LGFWAEGKDAEVQGGRGAGGKEFLYKFFSAPLLLCSRAPLLLSPVFLGVLFIGSLLGIPWREVGLK